MEQFGQGIVTQCDLSLIVAQMILIYLHFRIMEGLHLVT